MANYERDRDGQPFVGGDDHEDDEGSHLPVVIIIAILVLAAFGGVVWLAYNQGVARGRGEPRIALTQPAKSGGETSGIKVYQQPAAGEDEEAKATAPSAAAPAPAAQTPPVSPPAANTTAPSGQDTAPAAAQPAPTAAPAQNPPQMTAANPPPVAHSGQTPAPQPVKLAQAAPLPLAKKPEPAPVLPAAKTVTPNTQAPSTAAATPSIATKPPAPLGLAHPSPATAAPAPKTAATPAPEIRHTPEKLAPAKAAASGSYLLQIGAYKSEADAMTAWKAYQSKHAALLNGFGPDVQKADLGDKGTWYRLRIASFPDKDGATALCERLKAQNGSCFLAH